MGNDRYQELLLRWSHLLWNVLVMRKIYLHGHVD